MHDTKVNPSSLAVKVMPKQYYQNTSQVLNDECFKKLKEDFIAEEEPLQISLSYYDLTKQAYQTKILSITMRTPGEDRELIYGFLLCEGVINSQFDITHCEFDTEQHQSNAVCVTLAEHVQPNWKTIERQFTNHSSCGICGKTSLNALELKAPMSTNDTPVDKANAVTKISSHIICQLPQELRERQTIFAQTGGTHAAGLYCSGKFLAIAEDIGRHNAVDKVLGKSCLSQNENEGRTKHDTTILVLSGRISFELVQKAIMANIVMIVAVGAPSSLAIKAAQKFDLTLIGFTKPNSFNVYHGDWRLIP